MDFVRALVGIAFVVASVFSPSEARAHDTSVAYLDLTVEADTVRVEARLHGDDLGAPVGRSPLERPTREVALARADAVTRYVAARVAISQGSHRCPLASVLGSEVQPDRDGSYRLAVRFVARCARVIDELDIRDDLFFDIDDNHRAFARARAFGATFEKVFGVYDRRWNVHGSPSTLAVLRQYALLGVEHIVTGYDHLAFLLALLAALAARGTRSGLRPALAVVTSFTLAHSVTLALAALGVVRPSSRLVESTIALSIALVAAMDLARIRSDSSDQTQRTTPTITRAALGFGFGLVHGLGFAGALGELGLPRRALVRSLAAFNVGVELGQLALAAIAFPLLGTLALRLGDERAYRRRVLAPIAAALVLLGLYWFARRVAGV